MLWWQNIFEIEFFLEQFSSDLNLFWWNWCEDKSLWCLSPAFQAEATMKLGNKIFRLQNVVVSKYLQNQNFFDQISSILNLFWWNWYKDKSLWCLGLVFPTEATMKIGNKFIRLRNAVVSKYMQHQVFSWTISQYSELVLVELIQGQISLVFRSSISSRSNDEDW